MHSALASLGIVYPDEEVEAIFYQLESQFGALTFEAWIALLVEITKDDVSSADQLREAFRDLAGDKGYVTEQDLKFANLGTETVGFLTSVMPCVETEEEAADAAARKPMFDCEWHGTVYATDTPRPWIPGAVVRAPWSHAVRLYCGMCMDVMGIDGVAARSVEPKKEKLSTAKHRVKSVASAC